MAAYFGQPLNPRQKDFVKLYCRGCTAPEIARELHVSQDTAKSMLRDIKRKWSGGGMTRREFFDRAEAEGLVFQVAV